MVRRSTFGRPVAEPRSDEREALAFPAEVRAAGLPVGQDDDHVDSARAAVTQQALKVGPFFAAIGADTYVLIVAVSRGVTSLPGQLGGDRLVPCLVGVSMGRGARLAAVDPSV